MLGQAVVCPCCSRTFIATLELRAKKQPVGGRAFAIGGLLVGILFVIGGAALKVYDSANMTVKDKLAGKDSGIFSNRGGQAMVFGFVLTVMLGVFGFYVSRIRLGQAKRRAEKRSSEKQPPSAANGLTGSQ